MRQILIALLVCSFVIFCGPIAASGDANVKVSTSSDEVETEIRERIMGAAQILALLKENGELLSDERPVTLYFFGEQSDLDRLKADQALSGFRLRDGGETPMLIAEALAITDEEWVVTTTVTMIMTARKYSVDYDGWEAGLVRQGPG